MTSHTVCLSCSQKRHDTFSIWLLPHRTRLYDKHEALVEFLIMIMDTAADGKVQEHPSIAPRPNCQSTTSASRQRNYRGVCSARKCNAMLRISSDYIECTLVARYC